MDIEENQTSNLKEEHTSGFQFNKIKLLIKI